MIQEFPFANGEITAVLTGPDGTVKEVVEGKNLVVQIGRNYIASRMIDASQAVMTNMAVGTGSTAPSASDTFLASENGRTTLTATRNNNIVTYVATFGPGVGTGNINECGIFNSATANAGTMMCRSTSIVLTKGALDSLAITWTVTINAA